MNGTIKPHRLIHAAEYHRLQTALEQKLVLWNEAHALNPLQCTLENAPNTLDPTIEWCLTGEQPYPVGLWSTQSAMPLMHEAIFGDKAPSLSPIEALQPTFCTLYLGLFERLFEQSLQQHPSNAHLMHQSDWCYIGSPMLKLTLFCSKTNQESKQHRTALYLHPNWVCQALPTSSAAMKPISTLHSALAPIELQVQVTLHPVVLPLANILALNVGDVIQTDHRLTEPVSLVHQSISLTSAQLGQTNEYASIQII